MKKNLIRMAVMVACGTCSALAAAAEIKSVSVSGLVEVAVGTVNDYDGDNASGVVLQTAELTTEAVVNEWTSASVTILHEDDAPDTWEVDAGTITLGNLDKKPYYLTMGRMYVPFGNFATHLVTDPLTLELAEIRETAVQLGYVADNLSGSFFMFNGDTNTAGDDDTMQQFGFNIDYVMEKSGVTMEMGGAYISNIADSELITDSLGVFPTTLDSYVPGISAYFNYLRGPMSFMFEYIEAQSDFDAAELAFDGDGAKPSAYKLEFGYDFKQSGRDMTAAIAYQSTSEAVDLGLPEKRLSFGLSIALFENTTLGLEYLADTDYGTGDGGTGDKATAMGAQLAVEF